MYFLTLASRESDWHLFLSWPNFIMGSVENLNLSESRRLLMLKMTLPFLILAYLFVLARLFAKRYVRVSLAADDGMILVALVS